MAQNKTAINENAQNRTSFSLRHSRKSTTSFGRISVNDMTLCLPHDTHDFAIDQHITLKPTVEQLNSTITYKNRSYFVPLRTIWKNFDKYIARNPLDLHEHLSTPIERLNRSISDNSSFTAPTWTIARLWASLLSAWGDNNLQCFIRHSSSTVSNDNWYTPEYRRIYYNADTLQDRSTKINYSSTESFRYVSYLNSRLNGNGFLNGNNFNAINKTLTGVVNSAIQTETPSYHHPKFWYITDPDVCNFATFLRRTNYISGTLTSDIRSYFNSPVVCVVPCCCYDSNNDTLIWWVGCITEKDLTRYDFKNEGVFNKGIQKVLYLSNLSGGPYDENLDVSKTFGSVTDSSAGKWYDNTFACIIKGVSNGSLSLYACPSSTEGVSSSYDYLNNLSSTAPCWNFALLLSAMFGRELGKGSLCEQLGFPLFTYQNAVSLLDSLPSSLYQSGVYDYKFWCPRFTLEDGVSKPLSALPFFAYHKIVREHYRLPFEVFHDKYVGTESNTYWTQFVPTMWYGASTNNDIFEMSYTNTNKRQKDGTTLDTLAQLDYYYTNQINLLFFDEAPMLKTDYFTNMWKLQNHGLGELTSVDALEVTNSKISLLERIRKSIVAKIIACGGKDMSFSDVMFAHFGVRGVDSESTKKSIYIGGTNVLIEKSNVVSTTGSTTDGTLGQKATIGETNLDNTSHIQFHCEEFGLLLNLGHLEVENEYLNTCLGETDTEILTKPFANFQIALFQEYQNTGDEKVTPSTLGFSPLYRDDTTTTLGFADKNANLKDRPNLLLGDYGDYYINQNINCCRETPFTTLALSYDWLLAEPRRYNNVFVDTLHDNVLLDFVIDHYRKSYLTNCRPLGI